MDGTGQAGTVEQPAARPTRKIPTAPDPLDDGPIDAAGPSRSRGSARQRGWTAFEIVLGLAVVGAVLWPATAHPTDRLAGMLDAPYSAWLGWRLAELWGHGHLLTWTVPDALSPNGFDLRLIDGLLPAGVTALWSLLTRGNLFLSYNLALATGVGLDLWAGRRLALTFTSRRWLAFVAGVAFASAPALAGSAQGHITFVYAFALPLLIREAVLVARGDRVDAGDWGDRSLWWARVGGLLALAYLCSAYHLVFGAMALVLVLVAWPASAVWSRVALVQVAAAFAFAAVLLAPFIAARLAYERDERAAGSPAVVHTAESLAFSADLLGIATPPESLWIDLPVPKADLGPQLYAPLRPAFAGYLLLAALVGAALSGALARLAPSDAGGRSSRVKLPGRRPLLITAAVLWVLSLGPALHVAGRVIGQSGTDPPPLWLPYRWLQAVPGLGALRAPTRASYALAAVLTALVAIVGERILAIVDSRIADRNRARRAEALVAVALVVLIVLGLTGPVSTSDLWLTDTTRRSLEAVAARSISSTGTEDGVLIVPWGCRLDDPRIIALQSVHHRPSIGCSVSTSATRWYSDLDAWARSPELAALRCDPSFLERRPLPFDRSVRIGGPDGVARLRRDLGVRYIVIERALIPASGCDSVRDAVTTFERFELLSDDGTWQIIDLAHPR